MYLHALNVRREEGRGRENQDELRGPNLRLLRVRFGLGYLFSGVDLSALGPLVLKQCIYLSGL